MKVSVGVDVGSTNTKIVVLTPTEEPLGSHQLPSAWFSEAGGRQPRVLVDQLVTEIGVAIQRAGEASKEELTLIGVGVASFAESGVLVSSDGQDLTPVVPWWDTRGSALLSSLPIDFAESFPSVTGLPVSPQWSLMKLLWFRSQGLRVEGTWLSVAEYIAYRLTGQRYAEPSLASRTGLFDQDSGTALETAYRLLDAQNPLLPPIRPAGVAWGRGLTTSPVLAGVPVTVAGHDHLVAAYGNGITEANDLFNSFGTADALLRILPAALNGAQRGDLVTQGLTHGWHLRPGHCVLLGGTRGGLVLRRVLDLLGHDRRAELDREPDPGQSPVTGRSVGESVTIQGAEITAEDVVIRLHADAAPADVWAAALTHISDELAAVWLQMNAFAPRSGKIVASGGWTRMGSVWRTRQRLFPGVRRTQVDEAGAVGAAILGGLASAEDGAAGQGGN